MSSRQFTPSNVRQQAILHSGFFGVLWPKAEEKKKRRFLCRSDITLYPNLTWNTDKDESTQASRSAAYYGPVSDRSCAGDDVSKVRFGLEEEADK